MRTSGPSAGSVAPITSMKIQAPSGSPISAAGTASAAPPATTVARTWRGVAPTEASTA